MKKLSVEEAMAVNGGTTYQCPFGCNKTGGYWSVYWHCLSTGCFKKNQYLKACWQAGSWCLKKGLKLFIGGSPAGKHAR